MERIILTLIIAILFVSCSDCHEVDEIFNRYTDTTTYAIKNYSEQKIRIKLWNMDFCSIDTIINKESEIICKIYEYSSYTQLFPLADSCSMVYNDTTFITFYPFKDFSWDNLPITPQNHNDSLLMHYPFRQSNCKITIADTDNGKQRIFCQYTITEDDYNFAKNYGKMTKEYIE